jgi:tetratricopeptide (TPR) repeat protein
VITADHGESLGEHGEKTHANFLYEATVRVPLVVRAPGYPAPLRVEEPVSLVDVTPTVAALLGLEPPVGSEGVSLLPALAGVRASGGERVAYLETLYPFYHHGWSGFRGVRGARWKLIQGREPELYALPEDPGEQRNLARQESERVEALAALLPPEREPSRREARIDLDATTLAELRELGYAWSGAEAERPEGELPDPRERIHLLHEMDAAISAFARGQRQHGIAAAERVVAAEPRSAGFLRELAHMYLVTNHLAEAEATYARALALTPQDVDAWIARGVALRGLDRNEGALAAFERALRLDAANPVARHDHWATLLALGRTEEVQRRAAATLREDPGDPEAAWAAIVARGEAPAARAEALERALAAAQGDPTLSFELGKTLEDLGDLERAEALYAAALARVPSNTELRTRLVRLLASAGRWTEAAHLLGGASAGRLTPELLFLESEVRYRTGDVAGSAEAARAVAEMQPERADVWVTLGSIELAQGNLEAAREAYERAVALDTAAPDAWRRLAAVYARLGRDEEARAAEARARATAPAPPAAGAPRSPAPDVHDRLP